MSHVRRSSCPEGPDRLPEGQRTLGEICEDFARNEAAIRRHAADRGLSRRDFLQMLSAGAVAATGLASLAARGARAADAARSRVVVVTHPEVILREYRVNPPMVRQMLDRALVELSGAQDEKAAWQSVGKEDDFVAVKHNSMGAPTLHSHTEIHDAVAAQLAAQVGVKPERIVVVDRVVPEPYSELSEPFTLPSNGLQTRLRRLYTDHATAIVNVSVLKSHAGEGVSAALKNHLGSVNNPAAFHWWQPERLPRNLPELNALDPLRTKTRLCIVDAIRPLFAGGPADNEQYRWDFRGLIVGTDPVAVTAVGIRILEAKRKESVGKDWPMTAARQMVTYAQEIGLGNADADRIDRLDVDMA